MELCPTLSSVQYCCSYAEEVGSSSEDMNYTAWSQAGIRILSSYSCQGFFVLFCILLFISACVWLWLFINETKSDLHKGFQKLSLSSRVILLSLLPSQEYNRASEP